MPVGEHNCIAVHNIGKLFLQNSVCVDARSKRYIKGNDVAQRRSTTFDLRAILQERGNLRATSNKMMYKTRDSQVLKLKKVYVFPNVESIASAKSFSLGNLSLLNNFQKLSTVSNAVTILYICIKSCYACFN